jgi:hypothetical protein
LAAPAFEKKILTPIYSAMARDEMATITSDKWDDEVWGAAHVSPTGEPRAPLFFLFGKSDHWVADETRDELLRARGRRSRRTGGSYGDSKGGDGGSADDGNNNAWRPVMEVDETGEWPHAFGIRKCSDKILDSPFLVLGIGWLVNILLGCHSEIIVL